jgi:hypothetical protein
MLSFELLRRIGFKLKQLSEFEVKTALGYKTVAQVGASDEKTKGEKFREKIPLSTIYLLISSRGF